MHRSLLSKDVIVLNLHHDTGLGDLGDFALKSSIVDQDAGAELHSLTQLVIVRADTRRIALNRAIDNNLILLPGTQLHRLLLLEVASEERGPLSVKHEADIFVWLVLQDLSHLMNRNAVRLLQN